MLQIHHEGSGTPDNWHRLTPDTCHHNLRIKRKKNCYETLFFPHCPSLFGVPQKHIYLPSSVPLPLTFCSMSVVIMTTMLSQFAGILCVCMRLLVAVQVSGAGCNQFSCVCVCTCVQGCGLGFCRLSPPSSALHAGRKE